METVHFMKDRPLSEARDLIKYFASYFLVMLKQKKFSLGFREFLKVMIFLNNDLVSKNKNWVGSICVFL